MRRSTGRSTSGGRLDAVGELTKQLSMEILLDHFLRIDKQDQRIFLEYFGTFPLSTR